MFVGCSYTAGDGVSNNERFSDLLETIAADVQCHNYALSGSGQDQQTLIHKHFVPRIKPDVLILSPYGLLRTQHISQPSGSGPLDWADGVKAQAILLRFMVVSWFCSSLSNATAFIAGWRASRRSPKKGASLR